MLFRARTCCFEPARQRGTTRGLPVERAIRGAPSGDSNAPARRCGGYQRNSGIVDGRPTRMKKRAKACEKCSRKGGFSRHRGPIRFA